MHVYLCYCHCSICESKFWLSTFICTHHPGTQLLKTGRLGDLSPHCEKYGHYSSSTNSSTGCLQPSPRGLLQIPAHSHLCSVYHLSGSYHPLIQLPLSERSNPTSLNMLPISSCRHSSSLILTCIPTSPDDPIFLNNPKGQMSHDYL